MLINNRVKVKDFLDNRIKYIPKDEKAKKKN